METEEIQDACRDVFRAWLKCKVKSADVAAARTRLIERDERARRLSESYPFLFDMAFSDGFREDFLDEMLRAREAVVAGERTYHDASVRIGEAFKARFVDPVLNRTV